MKDKVLVELIIPDIDEKYYVYLPINKTIGNIIILLDKALREMMNNPQVVSDNNCLYDSESGGIYATNILLRDTNIRNASRLILM